MAVSSVADLTTDELKALIREVVKQTILELLGDPDTGLELREDFITSLQQSLDTVQAGQQTISAQDVADKLDLEW